MQFDVGIGDAVTPSARRAAFPVLLGMDIPKILVYPLLPHGHFLSHFLQKVRRGVLNGKTVWQLPYGTVTSTRPSA